MDKSYVIGVDMGGTNSVIGIVDARGSIVKQSQIKTNIYSTGVEYVDALCDAIKALVASVELEGQIKGVGMGVPNGNMYRGTIEYAPNIPWANKTVVPVAEMVSERTGIPCALTNDANAAAIGEKAYGAARGMKDFIVITLGTGVGSGIFSNGQLVGGSEGFAGELGHTTIFRHNGRSCGCGRSGCLESYTSATGVSRTAQEFLELRNEESILRDITDRPITSKDVYDAAEKGDAIAIDIFKYTGKLLGEAFSNFVVFSSPEAIILFGGLSKSGDYLIKPLKESMEKSMLNVFAGKTKILISELPDADAAVLGASALGWEAK